MTDLTVSGLRIGVVFLVGCLIAVGGVGTVIGDNPSHEVTIETPDQIVQDDGQTIEITVENLEDDDMVFPLVEVPLQDGLVVPEADRSDRPGDGDEFDDVTVEIDGATEDRLAFVDDSSYRNSEAIFIEGEELPADESKTYTFSVSIDTSSEVEIEADVRPLNREENNVRETKIINPVGTATIDAAFADAQNSITVDGTTDNGAVQTEVVGGETSQISADVSILPDELSLEVTPAENTVESVSFTDVETGEADDPIVAARTGSSAEITPGTTSKSFEPGTADDSSTKEVEFDLSVSSGVAHIVLEDSADVPLRGIESQGDFDEAEFVETDDQDVAVVVQDGAVDEIQSLQLEGYRLGDVTLSGDVTADDAQTIATAVASGESLSAYGDVTGDGDISAVDAMKIQQYHEDNRDEEYEVSN